MDVVIDIGNTRAKIALYQTNGFVEVFTSAMLPDENVVERLAKYNIRKGIISTVSANATVWANALPFIDWLLLSHQTPIPFINMYQTPHTLGLDRIALAAAAIKLFPNKNTLVIDAGTCVTYDFVDEKRTYLGGAISPGLHMRLKAMHHFTHKLPAVPLDIEVDFLESNTEKCMQAGALYGLVEEINGFISRYIRQFTHVQTVVTGGDAEKLAPLIKNSIFATPNFLADGLHAILLHNNN